MLRPRLCITMSSELLIEIVDDTPQNDGAAAIGKNDNSRFHTMSSVVDKFHNVTEVIEFAKYLGIDPNTESSLLWIAQEAINAPLPQGWSDHTDPSGNVYFYHAPTQESTWVHPLDDHYKHLVKRLRRTGGIKTPDVSSPVQSPGVKKSVRFDLEPGEKAGNKDRKKSKMGQGDDYQIKKVNRRGSSRRQRRRRKSADGESDMYDSCSSSCVDETETSATDQYDTEIESSNERGTGFLGRRSSSTKKKSANTSRRSRVNSPLLRRTKKRHSHSRQKSIFSHHRSDERVVDRRIQVDPSNDRLYSGGGKTVHTVEEMMDGTKSKDELQKLLMLAKSKGTNPTEMAVQIMMTDPKIKCALCCFCLFAFSAIVCVIVLKFAL